MMPMAEAPSTEKTALSRKVRRSVFGITLHGWEQLMLLALGATGLVAIAVALTTTSVVILQRHETAEAKRELEEYKVEAGTKISAAEAVGLTAKADIAKANVQIAEANARALEAELRLEQLRKDLGPRQLQRDVFIKEVKGQPTAHVEIMYLQDDPECFDLAQQIWRALEDGKWPVEAPKPIPSLIISDGPTPMSVGGQPSGVTVVVKEISDEESRASENAMMGREWVKTPWTTLTHALGLSLGKVVGRAGGQNAPPDGLLRVVVSPRL
jgi:hypothetical protein